ncbi:AAA family ATPase [Patescibacteria group bacterium]|nr:AAA family ATPase [Patescibacteria group bacterium]
MKLRFLVLRNFLSHEETDLDLSHGITLVQGRNGAGKSSIADAIKFALIGRCRSTDGAGRGADKLIRVGADECSVCLRFETADGAWLLVRSRSTSAGSVALTAPDGLTLTGRAAEGRLQGLLGSSADLIEAVLDAPSFFDLSPAKQSELLAGVLRLQYTISDVEKEARSFGLSAPAVEALSTALSKTTAGRGTFGPEILEALYERAYGKRADTKKALKALEASAPAGDGATVEVPTEEARATEASRLIELEAAAGKLRESLGSYKAKAEERERTLAEMARTHERLKAIKKATTSNAKKNPRVKLAAEIKEVEESLKDLSRSATNISATEEGLQDAVTQKRTVVDELEFEITAIEGGDVNCPSIHKPAVCPLSHAALDSKKGALPEMKQELDVQKALLVGIIHNMNTASQAYRDCSAEILATKTKLADLREQRAKEEGSDESGVEAFEERLAILEENLANIGEPHGDIARTQTRLEDALAKITITRQNIEQLNRRREAASRHQEIAGQLDDTRSKVALYEQLCTCLAPKGVPARLAWERVGPIEKRINGELHVITNGVYRVAIRSEGGLALDVLKGSDTRGLPIENLSSSERLRIGIALACALSRMSGLQILVIDNADILDAENRSLLAGGLGAMSVSGIVSVVVISTRESPSPSREDVSVYWMGGRAEDVEIEGVAVCPA